MAQDRAWVRLSCRWKDQELAAAECWSGVWFGWGSRDIFVENGVGVIEEKCAKGLEADWPDDYNEARKENRICRRRMLMAEKDYIAGTEARYKLIIDSNVLLTPWVPYG
jgi:hypothetical protein